MKTFLLVVAGLGFGLVILYFAIGTKLKPAGQDTLPSNFIPTVSRTLSDTPTPPIDNKVFIDPLSSSSASVNTFGEGQLCGGIGNIQCPPNLYCKKDESDREASGFCTKL